MKQRFAPMAMLTACILAVLMVPASHSQVVLQSQFLPPPDPPKQSSFAQRMGLSTFPDVEFVAANPSQLEIKNKLKDKIHGLRLRSSVLRSSATGTTNLLVYNPTTSSVQAWFSVPTTSSLGGPTLVSQLQAKDFKTGSLVPLNTPYTQSPGQNLQVGYLSLNAGQKVVVTANNAGNTTNTMDGVNVAFLSPPQCPCTSGCLGPVQYVPGPNVPNGVNIAEVTLNPTGASQQEGADISCLNGANTTITMTFSGGPSWNDGSGNITSTTNSSVDVSGQTDNNCGISGVYPYGLSGCTSGTSTCNPSGPFCTNSSATCDLQRSAGVNGFGGTVLVTFIGAL